MKFALLIALTAAGSAYAQFELQVVDSGGTARIAPPVYDLGSAYAGETLTARFRLRNPGSSTATVATLAAGGVGFALASPGLPAQVEPQASLEFTVNFRSSDLGSYSAALRAENVTILLTAAVTPRLSYRTENGPVGAVVDFGSVQRGSSIRRRFTVLNETPQILTIPAISLTGGDFAFAERVPSGMTLAPLQSQDFAIDFAPSVAGVRAAVLTLGERNSVLTGNGLEFPLPRPTLGIDLRQKASAQQGTLVIAFDQPARAAGMGTALLDFRGSADPTVAFAAGGRTATFAIAPGDTRVSLPFQTGTTAGTLLFSVQIGDSSDLLAVQIPTSPAVLTQAQGTRVGNVLDLRLTGWDNTHSISQLTFTFFDTAGNPVAPGIVRVDAAGEFSRHYTVSDAGGAFVLHAAFPVTGDATQVLAFEVSLTDLIGTTTSSRTTIQ